MDENHRGGCWNARHVTADGLEHTIAVNHLAPFLLTNLLPPFAISKPRRSSKRSYDEAVAARLWQVSAELVGLGEGV